MPPPFRRQSARPAAARRNVEAAACRPLGGGGTPGPSLGRRRYTRERRWTVSEEVVLIYGKDG